MDAVVIGAGAAGLAASWKLACAGLKVTVIEARSRAGGRVYSMPAGPSPAPFELGAEFIHGSRNAATDLCRRADLRMIEAQDRHWNFSKSGLTRERTLRETLEACLAQVKLDQRDLSFEKLLRQQSLKKSDERMLRLYVEGFDAADTTLLSSQSLAKAQSEGDDKSLRVQGGYGRLIEWLRAAAEIAGAQFRFSNVVQTIAWRKGAVEISAQTPSGRHIFRAPRAIITLPLGVLKAGAVRFVPELAAKAGALNGMQMGEVIKVSLQFGSCFWSKQIGLEDFGFIHGPQLSFPTWWSRKRAPLLAAWAGGPRALLLDRHDALAVALRDLRRLFGFSLAGLRGELRYWRFHDWSADPFARGAYSYTTTGNLDAPEQLAEPIAKTLIFAGEATVSGASQGTVHGALDSGMRAAAHVLEETMKL